MAGDSKNNIKKMASIYFQEGKWDKCIAEFNKLLTLDPNDFQTRSMLGDAYAKKGDDQLAYQEYTLAAEAHAKQGLADKAGTIYKKIARLDSNKLSEKDKKRQIFIQKTTTAEKLIETGETAKAIDTYKELLEINPESWDTYQKIGELYATSGDKAEAMKYFEKVVDVYFRSRMYKKALPIYQKILDIHPDNIEIREKIAEIYEREAQESDAKREYLYLAEYYWKQKNPEKTDFYAQKAVDFKSIEARYFKGGALYLKKNYDDAKKEIEMLLKFKANHTGALEVMALISADTGDTDGAINTLNKLTKADPENAEAVVKLAEIYYAKGMKKEGTEKAGVAYNIFIKKQDFGNAALVISRAIEKEPESIELLLKLAEAYNKGGKKKQAADTYIKISDIYTKEGMEDKAKESYKSAQELDPANPLIIERAKKMGASAPPPAAAPAAAPAKAPEPPKAAAPAPAAPAPQAPPAPAQPAAPSTGGLKITHTASSFGAKPAEPPKAPAPPAAPASPSVPKAPGVTQGFFGDLKMPAKPAAAAPKTDIPEKLPEISLDDIKLEDDKSPPAPPKQQPKPAAPAQQPAPAPAPAAAAPSQQGKEDIPALVAMADNYVKLGSFDEAIEMYQKAIELDPGNAQIKSKLNAAYSKYAGVPAPDSQEAVEAKKKKEEEERRKKEEEDKKKKEEEKKKADADAEAKKKREEEDRKKAASAGPDTVIADDGMGADFTTVTAAEIFIKQGLYTDAEKILAKILKKEPDNIEASMKLEELKTMKTGGKKGPDDDKPGKGKQSKVSYI